MFIEFVIIINPDGLPLYTSQMELEIDLDISLFAGFLAAATSLGPTLRSDFKLTDLNLGALRLIFHLGPLVTTVLGWVPQQTYEPERMVEDDQRLPYFNQLADIIGNAFQQQFQDQIITWDGHSQAFERFDPTIKAIVGTDHLLLEKKLYNLLSQLDEGELSRSNFVERVIEFLLTI